MDVLFTKRTKVIRLSKSIYRDDSFIYGETVKKYRLKETVGIRPLLSLHLHLPTHPPPLPPISSPSPPLCPSNSHRRVSAYGVEAEVTDIEVERAGADRSRAVVPQVHWLAWRWRGSMFRRNWRCFPSGPTPSLLPHPPPRVRCTCSSRGGQQRLHPPSSSPLLYRPPITRLIARQGERGDR